jgi:tetratricopeptide (TPR) repeat protein
MRLSSVALMSVVSFTGSLAGAENEGQEDLDKATEAKWDAKTLSDLDPVIRLCESALEKGLDEGNTQFANTLLASTLVQRGSKRAQLALSRALPDPKLPEFRRAALEDLEKAVKLNPELPRALLLVAQLNVLPGGDTKRGAEAIDQFFKLDVSEPELRAKTLVLRATLQKDPDKRLADLNEAIRVAPSEAAAFRARGAVHAGQRELEAALVDFDKAIELDPKHTRTYQAKATALALLKKFDEALETLDKACELNPRSVEPLVYKARIHAAAENLDAALVDLNLAYSVDPGNLEVLLRRAGVYQQLDQKEKALADVDQTLKLKPDLPPAMQLRAMLLADADKLDEAIAELERLRELQPGNVSAALQLGMLYNAAKRLDKAVEIFSDLLAKHADNWMALRSRGDARLNSGKQAEAIDDYEKAVKLQPRDPGILNNLAWVLATSPDEKLRNDKRAIKLATEACELTDYKQAHILSTLAAAYAETGDFETAIKWAQNSYGSSKGATGCLSARVSGGLSSALADKQPVAPFSKHVLRTRKETTSLFQRGSVGASRSTPRRIAK